MEENVNKKSGSKGVIIVLLLLIILGVVGYICYDKGLISIGGSEVEDKKDKEENKTKEEKEVEVTDNEVIKKMGIKIDTLFLSVMHNDYYEFKRSDAFNAYYFKFKVLKKELSDSDKQYIVLDNAAWEEISGEEWKKNTYMNNLFSHLNGISEESFRKASKQLSLEKFSELSNNLFGSKIENLQEEIGICPKYIYDKELKTFFKPDPACGGTSASYVSRYISKVTTKGDNLTVYVSFAYTGYEDNNVVKIHKDFDLKDDAIVFPTVEYKNLTDKTIENNGSMNAYELNESNYSEFSEYKFNFKKDSKGNYYFVNVEQVK